MHWWGAGSWRENDVFCINDDENCIENDEFCIENAELCRVPTKDMRAWYWHHEFPVVKWEKQQQKQQTESEGEGEGEGDTTSQLKWWDDSYNPGAAGMYGIAPPTKPNRLRPVALDRVWEWDARKR